jgi:hypothetical protein
MTAAVRSPYIAFAGEMCLPCLYLAMATFSCSTILAFIHHVTWLCQHMLPQKRVTLQLPSRLPLFIPLFQLSAIMSQYIR